MLSPHRHLRKVQDCQVVVLVANTTNPKRLPFACQKKGHPHLLTAPGSGPCPTPGMASLVQIPLWRIPTENSASQPLRPWSLDKTISPASNTGAVFSGYSCGCPALNGKRLNTRLLMIGVACFIFRHPLGGTSVFEDLCGRSGRRVGPSAR